MNIKVIKAGKEFVFQGKTNLSLLEQLREQNIYIDAVCGGKGTCGKCRIQMLSGAAEPEDIEQHCFSEKELEAGFRLACKTFPKADCTIVLDDLEETKFQAAVEYLGQRRKEIPRFQTISAQEEECVIAIDLGTTTIAMELAEKNSGQTLHTLTTVNRQRSYGADVISRIQAANEGKGTELQRCILEDLYQGIKRLLKESRVKPERVKIIGIAGNTTMGHLLMGYSCETLGVYPFTPVNIKTIIREFEEIFYKQQQEDGMEALDMEGKIILLPGISTYVGADIVAGILACQMDRKKKPCMFIDLGTNGEMVIGNRDKLLAASVAAGPAFEGGNISSGMGSMEGAVCKVSMKQEKVYFETIGNKEPLGLCGTGVVETMCELLKENIVDETGMMSEKFIEDGFFLGKKPDGSDILFTQKDVREIQMAKSAVRAGIETLRKHYDTTYEEIEEVFLAGGFGYQANVEKNIIIGMFPEEFRGKITIVGNSSLAGTIEYLTRADAMERCHEIIEKTQEAELSLDADFNDFYMKNMFFDNQALHKAGKEI